MYTKTRAQGTLTGTLILVLILALSPAVSQSVNAASISVGATCKTQLKGKTVTVGALKFKCTNSGGKLKWAAVKPKNQVLEQNPIAVPNLTLVLNDDTLNANVIIPSRSYLDSNNIDGLTIIWRLYNRNDRPEIGSQSYNKDELKTYESTQVGLTLKNLGTYANKEVGAEAFYIQKGKSGRSSVSSFYVPPVIEVAKPTPTPSSPPPSFTELTERDWQFILKDPNGNIGKFVVVYGKITQFDSVTGLDKFRANVSGTWSELTKYSFSGDNSFLMGNAKMLSNYVVDDRFKAKVKVAGVYSYTSISNTQISAPQLEILEIELIP
jgi:hypothetical protein